MVVYLLVLIKTGNAASAGQDACEHAYRAASDESADRGRWASQRSRLLPTLQAPSPETAARAAAAAVRLPPAIHAHASDQHWSCRGLFPGHAPRRSLL